MGGIQKYQSACDVQKSISDNVYKLRVVKAQCQERMKTLKCKMNAIPLQKIQKQGNMVN